MAKKKTSKKKSVKITKSSKKQENKEKKSRYLTSWFNKEIAKDVPSSFSEKKDEFVTEIRPRKNGKHKILKWVKFVSVFFIVFLILFAISSFFIFLFQVQSLTYEKNVMEKISLEKGENIRNSHVAYLLNEIGSYKLHETFYDGKDATILIWITNTGQKFTASVEAGTVKVEEVNTNNFDISISLDEKVFRKIYASDSAIKETKAQIERKRVFVEKSSKDLQLGLRGFRSLQKNIFPPKTALFFFTAAQLRFIYLVVVLLIIFFSIWYFKNS